MSIFGITHSLIHSFTQSVSRSTLRKVSLCVRCHGGPGDAMVDKTITWSSPSWSLYSSGRLLRKMLEVLYIK